MSPGRALLRAGVVALLLVAAGLALRGMGPGMLRAIRPTPLGALALVAVGGGLTASGLPRQMLAFAGGYAFGPWMGGALSLAGQMLGCMLDFVAARGIAGAWARRVLAKRKTVAALHAMLVAHPFTTTLTVRLLPVSNNLVVNLVAGVAGVRTPPFLAASLVGYIPQTIIFALLGSGTQLGRNVQLGAAAALFTISGGLGIILYRRVGRKILLF